MMLGHPHQQDVRCDVPDKSANSVTFLQRSGAFPPIILSINYGSWRWAANVMVDLKDGR